MSTTWGRLVGSTDVFAVDLRLIDDLDSTGFIDPDEVASWGSFQVWANGRNLTSHTEAGEQLESCHWYLLPLCEWLIASWDALLHEERLPGPDVRDAATGIERLSEHRLLTPALEDELDEQVRAWWQRHNLAVGALGSALPPTFMRRWGDLIEISVSGRSQPGVPGHVRHVGHLVERVPVGSVGPVLSDIFRAVTHELARRLPGSTRVANLRKAFDDLGSVDHQRDRHALLGQGRSFTPFDAVEEGVVVLEASLPALLFGCMAPTVSEGDVEAVLAMLDASFGYPSRTSDAPPLVGSSVNGLEPGPAGSSLGEDAWMSLADPSEIPVAIERVIESMGVRIETVTLSDRNIRSICVLDNDRAIVAVNPKFRSGEAEAVRRFSLAHELCHLLFDRGRAVSLAIASGPWAPQGLEQQANAFAAAYLMPSPLVQQVLSRLGNQGPRGQVEAIARALHVPFTSAADRLRNLGVLTYAEADEVKQRT